MQARADVVVWSRRFVVAALRLGARMHIKFNSGMGRLGVHEEACEALAEQITGGKGALIGLMSHFATADELEETFFLYQLDRFLALAGRLKVAYPGARHPRRQQRRDAARARAPAATWCAAASPSTGSRPWNEDPFSDDLRPAMRLSSYLAACVSWRPVTRSATGARFIAEVRPGSAIVPIGYADGIARALYQPRSRCSSPAGAAASGARSAWTSSR